MQCFQIVEIRKLIKQNNKKNLAIKKTDVILKNIFWMCNSIRIGQWEVV